MRYKRISPIMTSNTTPEPYVVAASSVYDAEHSPWCAFNFGVDGVDTYSRWATLSNQATPSWLSIDLGEPQIVNAYRIISRAQSWLSQTPKDWTFEGSNNGTDWDILDAQSVIWSYGNQPKFFTIDSQTAYRYYRLYITANLGGAYAGLDEFSLWQIAPGSNVYYVSQQNGDDNNDGLSPNTAWKTISKATTDIGIPVDEDVYIYIGPGVYREFVTLVNGGTDSSHRIIFAGDPNCVHLINDNPGIVRITGCNEDEIPSSVDSPIIKYNMQPYVEFWDMWIDGNVATPTYAVDGNIVNGGNGQIIRRVKLHSRLGFQNVECYECTAIGYVNYNSCTSYNCISISGGNTNVGGFYSGIAINCAALGGYYGYYNCASYSCIAISNAYGFYGSTSENCYIAYAAAGAYNTGTHKNMRMCQAGTTTNTHPLTLLDLNISTVLCDVLKDSGISYVSTIPPMTANNAPAPYVVSRSSVYGSTYEAWKAFSKINSASTDCWATVNGTNTGWLAIDTGRDTTINYYKLACRAASTALSWPKTWTLEGSNNGSTWEVIDSRENEMFVGNGEEKIFHLESPVTYRHYRINVTANGGLASYLAIGTFDFGLTTDITMPKDINGNTRIVEDGTVDIGPWENPNYIVDWDNYFETPPGIMINGAGEISFKFPVEANRDVIKLVRVKHVNTASDKKPRIICRGLGMEFSTSAASEPDTWELLSLTFTPSRTGIMELVLTTRDADPTAYSVFSDII